MELTKLKHSLEDRERKVLESENELAKKHLEPVKKNENEALMENPEVKVCYFYYKGKK